MLEGGKIGWRQAVFLNTNLIAATVFLSVPALVASFSKQDAWLSFLLTIVLGIFLTWLIVKLGSLFPGKTLFEYTEEILGRWLGKIFSILYLMWFIHIGSIVVWEFGSFLNEVLMPETPLLVFNTLSLLLAAYIIRLGLEVLARANQIFAIVAIFTVIVIVLLVSPEMDIKRFLPVLESSPENIFKGSLVSLGWVGEIFMFSMFIPFLKEPQKATQIALISILIIGLTFLTLIGASIAVFGAAIANMTYPFFDLTQTISIAETLDRLEPLVVAIWVTTGITKIAVFLYVTVLGSAQLFELKDYRPLIMPMGIVFATLSISLFDSFMEFGHIASHVWPFYALFTVEFGFPAFLLVIALIRGKGRFGQSQKPLR